MATAVDRVDTGYKLEVADLRMEYPGTTALDGVTLGFRGGEVHALLGKNGAGKSTLVKILSGATQPTAGSLLVDGREVRLRSPREAAGHGIATVHQELSLLPDLTVGENILFGRLPRKGFIIDWPRVFEQAQCILEAMNVKLDVRGKVERLSVASQQVVEIAKAMSLEPSVLLLDEPTSALAHGEAQSLFALIRSLAAHGVAIIYISHRLQELHEIADVMSVLRDGKLIGTTPMVDATPASIAQMMFGEAVPRNRLTDLPVQPETVLEVRGLSRKDSLRDVSFALQRGEVLGIAGMLGSGRSELLMSIFGAEPFDSGEIWVEGERVGHPTPATMKARGLGLAPEDRKRQGLVQMLSVSDNTVLASLESIATAGVLSPRQQRETVSRTVTDLQIKISDPNQTVSSLSGGNQQKVVVGKWLNTRPRVLLFDEPTRGIDVQAKQQIFNIIWELSRQGISTIFVSSELEELVEVCHRILVLREGRLVAEVSPEETSMEQLLALCMGSRNEALAQ